MSLKATAPSIGASALTLRGHDERNPATEHSRKPERAVVGLGDHMLAFPLRPTTLGTSSQTRSRSCPSRKAPRIQDITGGS